MYQFGGMIFVRIHKYNTMLLKELSERNGVALGLTFYFDNSDQNFKDDIILVHLYL